MERLTEILALLEAPESLTDEQVVELESELLDLFDGIRAGDVENIPANDAAVLRNITAAVTGLRALAAERMVAAEELANEIAELEATLRPPEAEVDPEIVAEADPEEAEAEPVVVPEPEVADLAPEPEPVLAAAPALSEVTKRAPVINTRPRAEAPKARPKARIAGPAGTMIASGDDIAAAMADAVNDSTSSMGKRRVVRISGDYSEERTLDLNQRRNVEKVEAMTAAAQDPASWTPAMIATGGFCAPAEVDYNEVVVAEAMRPVRDGLPSYGAPRGSVQMPASPTLSDVEDGVGQWTNTNDETPSDPSTKNIVTIDCSDFNTFESYAVTRRLEWGNFGERAFPENLAAWNRLLLAAHARLGEGLLLDGIKGLSTKVTTPQVFGAARDLVEAVIRIAAAQRSSERISGDTRFRAMLPEWVIDMMAADLTRSHRDDGSVAVSRDEIRRALNDGGINATFYKDSPSTGSPQVFDAQTAGAAQPWPCEVQWALFPEGRFQFLDGGTLDLGVIRDSTLNDTNDVQNFAETFEGVATAGGPQAVWVTSTVSTDGSAAADIDGSVSCGS